MNDGAQRGILPAMTNSEPDGAAVRLPPPLVFLGALVLGAVIQTFAPLRLELPFALRAGGALFAGAAGVALLAGALSLFRRTGQDPKPWEPTPEIVSTGIYRFTRNPMYVGMALLLLALGLAFANAWIVALVPTVLAVVYWTAVRHEEAYLERKFGAAYEAYKARTRRWL